MHTRTKCLYTIPADVDFALLTYLLLTYLLTYSLGIRTSRVAGNRYSLSYLFTWYQNYQGYSDSL